MHRTAMLLILMFPILDWGRTYDRAALSNDLIAAVIVTIMLIPQSLAYALLAGLPPEAGIYASIVPILLYAIFGTSRAPWRSGPVAVVSLLTASAIGQVAEQGTAGYAVAALTLAFLVGRVPRADGRFAAGLSGQFPQPPGDCRVHHRLGHPDRDQPVEAHAGGQRAWAHPAGNAGLDLSASGPDQPGITFGDRNLLATAFLFWVRKNLKPALNAVGSAAAALADVLTKAGPVAAVVVTTVLVWRLRDWTRAGVKIVGEVPSKPAAADPAGAVMGPDRSAAVPAHPDLDHRLCRKHLGRADARGQESASAIDPDQELIGLGAANLGAAFTGGFPVTGGFSRSVVNFDAGAETPAAGAFTAIGLAIAAIAPDTAWSITCPKRRWLQPSSLPCSALWTCPS